MASMKRLTVRYGVAVLAVAAAIALVLIPVIGKGLASILFLAVFVSAWYGGLGPGPVGHDADHRACRARLAF